MVVAQKSYYEAYDYKQNLNKNNNKKAKRTKKANKNKKSLVLAVLFFVLCFVIVLRYAALTQMANSIDKQNKMIADLEKTKSQFKTEVMIDLKTVDSIAKDKLAMDKPYGYQMVYVNLNEKKSTDLSLNNQDSKFDIVKKISKVVEFLY